MTTLVGTALVVITVRLICLSLIKMEFVKKRFQSVGVQDETSDRSKGIRACSAPNGNLTPPGFHITTVHSRGKKYGPNDSIGLAGLSGQDSLYPDRGRKSTASRTSLIESASVLPASRAQSA